MSEIKSVDAMDFINREDLLRDLAEFLCERQLSMLYFYDMICKPFKYINVFNEFLQSQNLKFEVVA
jgi:hypothetical protein